MVIVMKENSIYLSDLKNNSFYLKYKKALSEFQCYRNGVLPLCAAENIISEFSKQPLMLGLQERYILDGYLNYNEQANMIGSKKLLPFYKLVSSQCEDLFAAKYTDCRSLSGMNALQNILLALVKHGDTVLIQSPESGGHAALPNILEKLDINYLEIPYDYNNLNYDYDKANNVLNNNSIQFMLLAPTDILFLPNFNKFLIPSETTLIYDASQVLAFYINNQVENPLVSNNRVILMGGTHKTIPGVTKALIMTNDENLATKIDRVINPLYLRNTHMQNVASLVLTLLEMQYFAEEYCSHMLKNSNYLGEKLKQYGLDVINRKGVFSNTHQLFLHMEREIADNFFDLANRYGITLNVKNKKLFNGYGIRLGVQEITRYGWREEEIDVVSQILFLLYIKRTEQVPALLDQLATNKDIQYTFKRI